MLFLKDTNGDDKADVRKVLSTGWGTQRHARRPVEPAVRPRQLHLGRGRLLRLRRRDERQADEVRPGRLPLQAGRLASSSTSPDRPTTPGASASARRSTSSARPPTTIRASTSPSPTATSTAVPELTAGVRTISGPGYQSAGAVLRRALPDAVHPPGRRVRRLHRRGRASALHGARVPEGYWNRIAFITEPTAHLVGQGDHGAAGRRLRHARRLEPVASADEWISPVHAQVGPDGAVWVADWYNFIIQHNPTPPGYSNGPGQRLRDVDARQDARPHLPRRLSRRAARRSAPALSKTDPAGLVAALKSDNMLWRLHAQRLLVERGKMDVVPQLVALAARIRTVDAIGTNGAALHALWTLHGLGALTSTTSEGGRAAVQALKHPAAGVRKAAAMVLPATAETAERLGAILGSKVLADTDLHTRLAAILRARRAAGVGRRRQGALRRVARPGQLRRPLVEPRALHRRRPPQDAVPHPVPGRSGQAAPSTRCRSRCASAAPGPTGASRPPRSLASDWKKMEVPGSWESRGLTAFDGVVWFTRQIDWPADGAAGDGSRFGRIGNIGEVWVNGTSVAAAAVDPTAGRSPQVFEVPDGVLKPGANTITVRIQNLRGDGGFLGAPEAWSCRAATHKVPLAGTGATASSGRPTPPRSTAAPASWPRTWRRRARRRRPTPCWRATPVTGQGRRHAAPRRPQGSVEVGSAGADASAPGSSSTWSSPTPT